MMNTWCAAEKMHALASVFKCSHSACFANEVFQKIMVHFCKALSLSNYSQVVYAKPEAKFF